MAGKSLTKEFHHLMRTIGRLTDDQASIDDVDWDEGGLSSFRVTIRPNASYYKGGRFKFTVRIPHGFQDGQPPNVWCDTDIYHPNIDRHTSSGEGISNVCLSLFDNRTWSKCHGLEDVIIGILYLMHHPNLRDPLSMAFDSSCISDEEFRKNVLDYMAGKTVDDEFEFSIDFRVIDGEFKDLTLTENSIGGSTNEDGIAGESCDTNDRGNGNDVVEAIEGPTDDTEHDVENENILAQDFHRLARRIGRVTNGQAIIDGEEWHAEDLYSFKVTIWPNAGYYKGGRFKFKVELPDAGEMIDVWCETEIYHPNIEPWDHGRIYTDVCFDSFDTTTESQFRSIERMVLKLVFLMHHPNLNDPTSSEFESGTITEEEFRKNVLDYMAGEIARYTIDFCVIDGVFKDLTLIEDSEDEDEIAAANCDIDAVNSISIDSDIVKNMVENKADIVSKVLNDEKVEVFDDHISLVDVSKTTADDMHSLNKSTELDPDHSKDHIADF